MTEYSIKGAKARKTELILFLELLILCTNVKGGEQIVKVRKMVFASTMAFMLAFSSFLVLPAFAVSFEDTLGIEGESSVYKLVSLGVMSNPGNEFNPSANLSGTEFANMAKAVGITDASAGKTVTYAQLAKVIANGLGLKSAWTNRAIDHLYFLERKGVLDIDTDLDANVTRQAAAVAFDRYITLKGTFATKTGVVVTNSEGNITLTTDSGTANYPVSKDASAFVSGQYQGVDTIQQGSPVEVTLNKQGQIAFIISEYLDAEEGPLVLEGGKMKIGESFVKDVNLNAYFAPLPNKPNDVFTFATFSDYMKKGVAFGGQAFFTSEGEISLVYAHAAKVSGATIVLSNAGVRTDLEGLSLLFELSDEVIVKIDEAESSIDDLKAYLTKRDASYTATVEADAFGSAVGIEVTTTVEEKKD